jgi:uncharacterized protein YebE (UPF0316 family)
MPDLNRSLLSESENADTLNGLGDVVITSPLQFQGLMYDGTNWVNSNIPDVYLVRNNTGSTILKGTLVGAVGAEPSGRIDVAPFEVTGTENSELRAMGIATSNISSGVNGEVMSFGTLAGLDTRGSTASALAVGDETWAAGDILFAHPTVAGKLTNVRPQHDLAVAFITVLHASTGQIAIRIIPGNNHLEWMHDVSLVDKASGDFLKYNGTLWVNDPINLGTDTVGNYMSNITAGTGITVSHTPGEGSSASVSLDATLDNLSDVTAPSPTDGEFLKYVESPPAAVPGTGAAVWTTRTSNFDNTMNIRSLAYGNNTWVAAGLQGQIRTSTDAITWTTQTSNFGGTHITSIAYGNSLWVAAGYYGQIRTSTDAITWTTRTSNFGTTEIFSVAYGNNLWVAGGYQGQLRTSTDGTTWTTRTSNFGADETIQSVAYGNNLWIAGGYSGQLRTSTDGTTWTTRTSNFGTTNISSVAYGNNLWVAGGDYGKIRTSTDGTTWTTRTSTFGDFNIKGIAYGNGLWVGVSSGGGPGQIRTSTDGTTWTTQTLDGSNGLFTVAYGNSLWAVGGIGGELATSAVDVASSSGWVPAAVPTINALDDVGNVNAPSPTDGQVLKYVSASNTWVAANATGGATTTSIAANTATTIDSFALSAAHAAEFTVKVEQGSRFLSNKVLVLHNGTTADFTKYGEISIGATDTVAGTGAVTWTTQTSNFGITRINAVAYGNSLWVAVGNTGQLRTSTDGTTWTTQTSNFASNFTGNIRSVAFGNNLWVAGGYNGQIRTSTDGTTWTTRTSNFPSDFNGNIFSVAYGNNLWVAGAYGGNLRTSTDGTTWTTQTSNFGNNAIYSVAYGNSLWVAAGYAGQLRTSTDGTTWTTRTSNFSGENIRSIAYGNNLWVAGGGSGNLRTSTDAITWTTGTSNFGSSIITSVAYGNNLWVAAGYSGQIRTSTDAVTWTTRTSNFDNDIRSIAYGNNLWVAGGIAGQLRTSAATTAFNEVPLTLSADISGSDVRLRATITDAATTNATVKVLKTIVEE